MGCGASTPQEMDAALVAAAERSRRFRSPVVEFGGGGGGSSPGAQAEFMTSTELYNLLQDPARPFLLFDARAEDEFLRERIDSALSFDVYVLRDARRAARQLLSLDELDQSRTVVGVYSDATAGVQKARAEDAAAVLCALRPLVGPVRVLRGGLQHFRGVYPFLLTSHARYQPLRLYPSQIAPLVFAAPSALAYERSSVEPLQLVYFLNATADQPDVADVWRAPDALCVCRRAPLVEGGAPGGAAGAAGEAELLLDAARFVHTAVTARCRVLVHSRTCESRAMAVLAAYLIVAENVSLRKAVRWLTHCRSSFRIADSLLAALRQIEQRFLVHAAGDELGADEMRSRSHELAIHS